MEPLSRQKLLIHTHQAVHLIPTNLSMCCHRMAATCETYIDVVWPDSAGWLLPGCGSAIGGGVLTAERKRCLYGVCCIAQCLAICLEELNLCMLLGSAPSPAASPGHSAARAIVDRGWAVEQRWATASWCARSTRSRGVAHCCKQHDAARLVARVAADTAMLLKSQSVS